MTAFNQLIASEIWTCACCKQPCVKNAEALIFSRRGSKKFEDPPGRGEGKKFWDRGADYPLHAMSQMPYNVIFKTEINFTVRSRYVFLFYIFLSYLQLLWCLAFSLCQSNLYIVLAHGKSPTNSSHRNLFKTKTLKEIKPHWP